MSPEAIDTRSIVLEAIDALAFKAERKRAAAKLRQRRWRADKYRIDYYPSAEAVEIVDSRRKDCVGGDASSIINRALEDWAAKR
jgi:hypothetical protein